MVFCVRFELNNEDIALQIVPEILVVFGRGRLDDLAEVVVTGQVFPNQILVNVIDVGRIGGIETNDSDFRGRCREALCVSRYNGSIAGDAAHGGFSNVDKYRIRALTADRGPVA